MVQIHFSNPMERKTMPDLRFIELFAVTGKLGEINKHPLSDPLTEVGQSLQDNVLRIGHLVDLAPSLMGWTSIFQSYEAIGCFESTGNPELTEKQQSDPVLMKKVHEAMKARHDRDYKEFFSPDPVKGIARVLGLGVKRLGQIHGLVPVVSEGMNVVLASVITGMWTAFEVLAGDLWVAALNSHPHGLSNMRGKLDRWELDKEQAEAADRESQSQGKDKDAGPQISVKWLQRHNYDVSKRMGSLLRERKSVDFQTVWEIRDAYARAFSKDWNNIRACLMSPCLDHLSAVRNVLVHKAGKADQKFVDDIGGCRHFSDIKPRDPVVLTGEVVGDLLGSAVDQSAALLSAVDAWLRKHPNKNHEEH
jgi:hypothetical protein